MLGLCENREAWCDLASFCGLCLDEFLHFMWLPLLLLLRVFLLAAAVSSHRARPQVLSISGNYADLPVEIQSRTVL